MITLPTCKKDKSRKAKESGLIGVWHKDYLNQSTNTIGINPHPVISELQMESIRKML
jgi:hypothetical protein